MVRSTGTAAVDNEVSVKMENVREHKRVSAKRIRDRLKQEAANGNPVAIGKLARQQQLRCQRYARAKAANAQRPAKTRATEALRALGLNRLPDMDWLTTMPSSGGRMQRGVLERCQQRVRAMC